MQRLGGRMCVNLPLRQKLRPTSEQMKLAALDSLCLRDLSRYRQRSSGMGRTVGWRARLQRDRRLALTESKRCALYKLQEVDGN